MLAKFQSKHPGSSVLHVAFFNCCRMIVHAIFIVIYRRRREGLENVPRTGGVLLVANHQSFFDPPLIGGALTTRDTDFLARGGLFKFKPFAWLISTLNATPIKQGAGDTGAMKEVIKRLNEHKAVIVFPEGSRSDDGKVQPFERGISVLLKRAKCVVVPVGIAGVYEVWPRHKSCPRLFTRPVAIVYGEPIGTEVLLENGADQAIQEIQQRVEALVARAEELRR
tara:strand:- start:125363 stop:126034 length:672 start_codon:yes stop_codon:yes gene_type:complete